jgi:hypothetical protein
MGVAVELPFGVLASQQTCHPAKGTGSAEIGGGS